MDFFEKLNSDLEPLGGEMHVDAFAQARRAAAEKRRAAAPQHPKAAPPREARPPAPGRPPALAAPSPPLESRPAAPSPDSVTDTGRLRVEVQEFLSRDAVEGTDDLEVQEFLKDRRGFDPTELE